MNLLIILGLYLLVLALFIRFFGWLKRRDHEMPMPTNYSHEYYGPEYWPAYRTRIIPFAFGWQIQVDEKGWHIYRVPAFLRAIDMSPGERIMHGIMFGIISVGIVAAIVSLIWGYFYLIVHCGGA